jgi:hypothetical protein
LGRGNEGTDGVCEAVYRRLIYCLKTLSVVGAVVSGVDFYDDRRIMTRRKNEVVAYFDVLGRFHPFYRPRRPLGKVEI